MTFVLSSAAAEAEAVPMGSGSQSRPAPDEEGRPDCWIPVQVGDDGGRAGRPAYAERGRSELAGRLNDARSGPDAPGSVTTTPNSRLCLIVKDV